MTIEQDPGLVERIGVLETSEAARALVARYAMAVDTEDVDALRVVFAADAVLSSTQWRREGLDAIVAYFREQFATSPCARRHFITTVAVRDAGVDSATVDSYFLFTTASSGTSILGWGRYRDRVARVEKQLQIVDKHIAIDHRGPLSTGWADRLAAEVAAR